MRFRVWALVVAGSSPKKGPFLVLLDIRFRNVIENQKKGHDLENYLNVRASSGLH